MYSVNLIDFSYMSRTTDLGASSWSATQGWPWREAPKAGSSSSPRCVGPGHLGEQLHGLVVLDAVGLHLGDGLAAGLELLGRQHLARVVQGRLDDRQHVQGVRRRRGPQQVDGGQGERRKRLVEREVELQVHREPGPAAQLL